MRMLSIVICLLLISRIGVSQKYTPFDFSKGTWVCGYYTKGGVFGNYGTRYVNEEIKFYCQGDTLISDTAYRKLYYVGYSLCENSDSVKNISGYFAAVRNDSINKRVWSKKHYQSVILYDFNLDVGDSIAFCCSEPNARINSIDSVLYCDKYHKRFNYRDANNYGQFIIEGIGSSYGLFPVNCLTSFSYLICYSEKNNVCDTCKTHAKIKEVSPIRLSVYPNPTSDNINISSEAILSSIEIFDLTDRLVYVNYYVHSNKIEIHIQQRGIYILKVRINEETIVTKLIKE